MACGDWQQQNVISSSSNASGWFGHTGTSNPNIGNHTPLDQMTGGYITYGSTNSVPYDQVATANRLAGLEAQFAQLVIRLAELESKNRDLKRELDEIKADPIEAIKHRISEFELRH